MGPASRSFSKADISSKELQVVAAAVEEKAKPLDEKKDPCLFAKRTNSMELERKSSVRNSFSEKTMAARVRQAFTVNKLPFHSVGLQGRDNEVLILSRCLEQQRQMGQRQKHQQEESNQPTVFRQVVWIAGDSGTGKTKLASSLKQQVRRTTNKGAFVMGKFDLLQHSQNNNEPYTGIVAACRNLCLEYILPAMRSQQHNNQHALSLLRDQIVRDLQMCPVLFHLIPELEYFWQTECSTKHQQQLLLPPLPPQNMTMTTTTTTARSSGTQTTLPLCLSDLYFGHFVSFFSIGSALGRLAMGGYGIPRTLRSTCAGQAQSEFDDCGLLPFQRSIRDSFLFQTHARPPQSS